MKNADLQYLVGIVLQKPNKNILHTSLESLIEGLETLNFTYNLQEYRLGEIE